MAIQVIVYYQFYILGSYLFGEYGMKYDPDNLFEGYKRMNFIDVYNGFLTLFVISTGAGSIALIQKEFE